MKNDKLSREVEEAGAGFWASLLARVFERLIGILVVYKRRKYQRVVSLGDLFVDREEKARYLGFGEGSTVYDNVLVLGDVRVGAGTWIGPNVILDGSGGLTIGNHCVISAGAQVYTHDTVQATVSGGQKPYEYAATVVQDHCYIGPNVVIQKGVTIGEYAVIGANSFVNKDVPARMKAYGSPARVAGPSVPSGQSQP